MEGISLRKFMDLTCCFSDIPVGPDGGSFKCISILAFSFKTLAVRYPLPKPAESQSLFVEVLYLIE